jgi:sulfur carrier protein
MQNSYRQLSGSIMNIRVNGTIHAVQEGDPLHSVMKMLRMDEKKGIAVAVNAEVIPKREWPQFILHAEDEIIIIEAAQGG